jgi:hypothetical protein
MHKTLALPGGSTIASTATTGFSTAPPTKRYFYLLGILIAGSPRLRQRIKLRFVLTIVTGEQRPHSASDAAILVGIVRFERIVQLIEEDRQVAVTLAQRGGQHFTAGNSSRLRNIFLLLLLRYRFDPKIYKTYIFISSRSLAEELAEPHRSSLNSSRSRADSIRIRTVSFVMRGLDPRIHADLPQSKPLR